MQPSRSILVYGCLLLLLIFSSLLLLLLLLLVLSSFIVLVSFVSFPDYLSPSFATSHPLLLLLVSPYSFSLSPSPRITSLLLLPEAVAGLISRLRH